jgi:hypothetical protein
VRERLVLRKLSRIVYKPDMQVRRLVLSSVLRSAVLLFTPVAFACPFCHTSTGRQVQAGIFNASFGIKLLVTAAPFPIFAGLIAFLYFQVPRTRNFDKEPENKDGDHS